MQNASIKRAPTLFLKTIVVLIGAAVLALSVFLFPWLYVELMKLPQFLHVIYPALFGFYATVIPFYFALYQAFTLLHSIDKNNAFSESSVNALKKIKYCAIAMSALYWMCMPLVFVLSDMDDAPGGILIGAALACSPLIPATFAAVLQKLFQNAVDMKLENDLTV